MIVQLLELLKVETSRDLSRVRRAVAEHADRLLFSTLARTRLVTAASELSRNMLTYAGGGSARVESLGEGFGETPRVGLRVVFEDEGPGIEDPEIALADGFTTGEGLGLGLGGTRRLVDEFSIESTVGRGTKVTITSWRVP